MRAFAKNGSPIIGTYDMIPGVATIIGSSFKRTTEGCDFVDFDYAGETEIDWDEQATLRKGGLRMFVAEDGSQVTEDELVLKEDEDDEDDCLDEEND